MKCTGKTKKSGKIEKVNMEESVEEESEEEEHEDEICIEAEKENEEEMVKNTKKGQKCINLKEPSTSKKKTMNKSEEEENYSNSEDEEELKKVKWKKEVKKPSKQVKHPTCNTRSSPKPLFDSTLFPDLNIIRHRPTIRSWNTHMMRKRIMMETSKGCLGNIEHHEDFDPDEEQNGIDLYKGLDEFYEKIIEKFTKISEERIQSLWMSIVRVRVMHTTTRRMVMRRRRKKEMILVKKQGEQKDDEEDDQDDLNNEHEFKNLTGDDRDVTFSMEVDETENKEKQTEIVKEQEAEKEKEKQAENKEKQDDIGKGTKKAGSETKNDEDEVHAKVDDLNERMKDKEADKQNVNDGNENEKDKQDEHHHLTQNEFWNEEYDLTESQCEELEYQATQKIKKNKTPKRKKPEDMTPPTFSFGLTPDESKPTQKEKEKQVKKRAKGLSPLESEPKPKEKEEKTEKRAKRPSRFFVSPYLNKKTAIKGKPTIDEVMMTEYLFSMEGEEFDFVFETKDGAATIRDYMQTLASQLKVESNVIDTFSLVLNHEQKMNSKGKKTKYFFHTTMIVNKRHVQLKKANGKYDEEKQFEAFSKTIQSEFKSDPEMENMKDLEMALFPIIAHEHYYPVVFNFLKGNTVIIDNLNTRMTYEAKCKTICELLARKGSRLCKILQLSGQHSKEAVNNSYEVACLAKGVVNQGTITMPQRLLSILIGMVVVL
nr:hypothetical protein [Tanacetum cinerariifolium]